MNFAIVGATGNVGRKIIDILEKSKIKIDNLFLVASKRSAGKTITFKKKNIKVESLESYDFTNATRNGVIYPSLDPSIFEVKFPNSDIKGKVLGDNLGIQE